jgi:hypothetical protein
LPSLDSEGISAAVVARTPADFDLDKEVDEEDDRTADCLTSEAVEAAEAAEEAGVVGADEAEADWTLLWGRGWGGTCLPLPPLLLSFKKFR